MKLLIVSQVFYPEIGTGSLRMTTIASELAKSGHDVTVLCPVPSYPARDLYQNRSFDEWGVFDTSLERVRIIRIPCLGIREHFSKVNRCLNYLSFWLRCRSHLGNCHNYDAVIATSPQLLSGLVGIRAKKFGIPFIFDVRDLWPEVISEMKIFRFRPLLRFLYSLEERILRAADAVCVNSLDYIPYIRSKFPDKEVTYIPNMVSDAVLAQEPKQTDHSLFVISYTGNIGLAQDFDTLLDAAFLLRDEKKIFFQFYGAGSAYHALEKKIHALSLPNVHICNAVPRKYVSDILARTDLCYIGIRGAGSFHAVTPGKLAECFAFGKPVILAAKGISRSIIEESHAGYGVDPGDSAALADIIRKLSRNSDHLLEQLGHNALEYARQHYSSSVLARQYELLIERNLKTYEKKPSQS